MKNLRYLFLFLVPLFAACGTSTTEVPADSTANMDSLAMLNEQIRKEPNNLELYYQRALYYEQRKDLGAALLDINRVLQLDSNNVKYLMAGADIHLFTNKIQRADQLLKRAVQLEPNNVECLLKMAQLHHYLKRFEEEVIVLNTILDNDKRNAQAYFMKGMVAKETGDTVKAMQNLQLAVQMDPNYYNAYIVMGVIAADQGN